MRSSWEGEVEWGMLIAARMTSSAPAWHLPQLPPSSRAVFLGTYRQPSRFTSLHFATYILSGKLEQSIHLIHSFDCFFWGGFWFFLS
ncbi:hypothetical protein VN97_g2461 [Penicillium thymicola]|uniref:Uncharacterized protein n=1 Tax=Penicillium thymicola TaxID=293382 RepID=A0AAI9XC74_PENTH|nr:hypothetical protein VN97_g2461 [Penicillium thymicola]